MRVRLRLAWRSTYVTTVVPGLMRTGSHLNPEFKRQDRKEFLWFSMGDTLPMSSISAADAARQIVAAIERGDAEVILTWQRQAAGAGPRAGTWPNFRHPSTGQPCATRAPPWRGRFAICHRSTRVRRR